MPEPGAPALTQVSASQAADPLVPPRETLACPACEYPIPSGTPRCSECGFAPSDSDWSARHRRGYFLEFTRRMWITPVVVCLLLSLPIPYYLTVYLTLVALAATLLIGKGLPRLYARLLRQAWLISIPWLVGPWLVFALAFQLAWILPRYVYALTDLPYYLQMRGRGAFGGVFISALVLMVTLVCRTAWRFRWGRLCELATIPEEHRRSGVAAIGTRLAFYPGLFLAAVIFIGFGLVPLLDAIVPGWDRQG